MAAKLAVDATNHQSPRQDEGQGFHDPLVSIIFLTLKTIPLLACAPFVCLVEPSE
jgi:hypothetical protein